MDHYQSPLPAQTAESARPEAASRLSAVEAQMGRIPNMYANMANSPGLFASYLDGYQQFRQLSGFSPVEQEVIFLTISRFYECEYCMAAHSTIADKVSKVPTEITDAIRNDLPIADANLAGIAALTRELLSSAGRPSHTTVDAFLAAGYSHAQVLDVVHAISVKILSNWSNHIFGTEIDERFADRKWSAP
jgi:AhpD family alkylhydroperoxidase